MEAPEETLETVARFTDPIEASLAEDRLREAGIEVFSSGLESSALQYPPGVTIDLSVRSGDAERARIELARMQDSEGERS